MRVINCRNMNNVTTSFRYEKIDFIFKSIIFIEQLDNILIVNLYY